MTLLRPVTILMVVTMLFIGSALAAETSGAPELTGDEVQTLIRTLEDPAARQVLLDQLKALTQLQPESPPTSALPTAAAQLFDGLSQRLNWALKTPEGTRFLLRASLLTLAALFLGALFLKGLKVLLGRGLRLNDLLNTRFPGLETRTRRYRSLGQGSLTVLVWFIVGLAVLQAWGLDAFAWLASEPARMLGGTAARVITILALTLVIWEVVNTLMEHYLLATDENGVAVHSARSRTLMAVARKTLLVVLVVLATLMVLAELGINIGPLLAGAGVIGLAVGFGSQKLVQDVITGIFILFEDLIAVGDVVNLGDKAGVVEAVSIRTVRLRDQAGAVHTIPFSAINTVSNLTKDFSYYVFQVGVAYRESVDEVMAVLRQIGEELQSDPEFGPLILEPLDILGVDAFADSAVIIKARFKTLPIKQWRVGREFNRRLKNTFDALGIEIPFPHTTVYFGENKGGGAPPAFVALAREGQKQALAQE